MTADEKKQRKRRSNKLIYAAVPVAVTGIIVPTLAVPAMFVTIVVVGLSILIQKK